MTKNITLSKAYDEFMVGLCADGKACSTVRWYRSRLSPLVQFLGGDRRLAVLCPADVREYILALRARRGRYSDHYYRKPQEGGLSLSSLHGHLRALRFFFKWVTEEYSLEWVNPMSRIRFPRLDHSSPKAASLDDLHKLLDACGDDQIGIRNRAMLLFLADTGCRAGGLLGLSLDSLDLAAGTAIVTEKGNRTRTLYLSNVTISVLRHWLTKRPSGRSEAVFTSLGCNHYGRSLTLGGLHGVLRCLKRLAGVGGRVNPHAWRHAFGVAYVNAGGDAASLRRLLGHSDVSTTLTFYVVHNDHELRQKHDQFTPLRGIIYADENVQQAPGNLS